MVYTPLATLPSSEEQNRLRDRFFTSRVPKNRKCLTQQQKLAIALVLDGRPAKEVSAVVGLSVSAIGNLMNDTRTIATIQQVSAAWRQELNALFPAALHVVREGLQVADTKTKLLAVDRFVKLTGAEERVVEPQVNNSITFVGSTRIQFFESLRKAAEDEGVLEGKVVKEEVEKEDELVNDAA